MDQPNAFPAQNPQCSQNSAPHHNYYCRPFYNNPSPICQQCQETTVTIAILQTKVAVLETQLKIAQAEKKDAEDQVIRYLLKLNTALNSSVTQSSAPKKSTSKYIRRIHRAEAERDCMNRMLKQALKIITRSSHTSHRKSPLKDKISNDTECLDTDLLGIDETSTQKELDGLFPALEASNGREENHSESDESEVARLSIPTRTSLTSDSDRLSESSYIFHFAHSFEGSSSSSASDKVMLINPQKASRTSNTFEQSDNTSKISASFHHEKQLWSDDISTAINSASAEFKTTETIPREWSCVESESTSEESVQGCDIPLILEPLTSPSTTDKVTSWNKFAKRQTTSQIENDSATIEANGAHEVPVLCIPSSKKFVNHNTKPGFLDRVSNEVLNLGICFNPISGSWNTFRTIIMSNVPSEATIHKLLSQVRGGVITDVKLLNTMTITGSNTAIITFLHQRSASAFAMHANDHPIEIYNRTINVQHSQNPTWPGPFLSQRAAFDGLQTRCLCIRGLHKAISPAELHSDLRLCTSMTVSGIEYITQRLGVVNIRFNSIRYAVQARETLALEPKYRKCMVRFALDPCAGPLGTELRNRDEGGVDVSDGRLSKINWEKDPPHDQRGRGFSVRD